MEPWAAVGAVASPPVWAGRPRFGRALALNPSSRSRKGRAERADAGVALGARRSLREPGLNPGPTEATAGPLPVRAARAAPGRVP